MMLADIFDTLRASFGITCAGTQDGSATPFRQLAAQQSPT
jgi:hypothetical protein